MTAAFSWLTLLCQAHALQVDGAHRVLPAQVHEPASLLDGRLRAVEGVHLDQRLPSVVCHACQRQQQGLRQSWLYALR